MEDCSHETTTIHNVGFDIYSTEEGDVVEENQYLEKCTICGMERFILDCTHLSGKESEPFKGKWNRPGRARM